MDVSTSNEREVDFENIFLHVTKACNLRCVYCYFSARRPLPYELSRDEYLGFWPDVIHVRPRKLVFTGGEPLLRKDMVQLLSDFCAANNERRVLSCLNTNGHLVNRSVASELVGLVDEVRVSVDALSERNDNLRGRGNFRASLNALDRLKEVGFEPKALITITSESVRDLGDLLVLLMERGISRFNLNLFRPIGRGASRAGLRADDIKVQRALRSAQKKFAGSAIRQRPIIDDTVHTVSSALNCGVGRFINILPNGEVYPCHVLTDKEFCCGNIRGQGLLEICSADGPLKRLSRLDFNDIARQERRLSGLAGPVKCMGDIYATTKSLGVWRENLSLPVLK